MTPHIAVLTIYAVHAILVLRLYGLYSKKRFVYGLSLLLIVTLSVDIYIAVTMLPRFDTVLTIPGIETVCAGDTSTHFAFIWYGAIPEDVISS